MFDATQLTKAISDVETAQTNLVAADGSQQRAQEKYDAALAAKTQADTDDLAAVGAFNATLDGLIAAATSAKIDRTAAATTAAAPAAA